MPKSKAKPKKPVQPVAPAPPPAPEPVVETPPPVGLPVKYPHLTITEYSSASPKGPLSVADWKEILGWETEKEFQARMVAEARATGDTAVKPERFQFGEGVLKEDGTIQPVHCKDLSGQKVVCWNNANNRPFDQDWCDSLIHGILYGQWAGPHTIPGETVNGETVRISRYGRVLSGQHQGTAVILAKQWLDRARENGTDHPDFPKYPLWRIYSEPFIETIIITGLSEDPRVLMTIDYVKPRTAADVFYTSELFRASTPTDRKELCRVLASAVDLLWTRTDARGYRTHPELVGFLERHKRLLKCVEHLYAENSSAAGRKISKLRLSPGHCAALMYLQASSGPKTDGDSYRNEDPAPSEQHLDWSMWDHAEAFWTLLAGGKDFFPVRHALGRLVESEASNLDNQGQGGRMPEKLAILSHAWERWLNHRGDRQVFDDADLEPGGDLCLNYSNLDDKGNVLPDGQIKLLDVADFYGIDCPSTTARPQPSRAAPEPPPPTGEEYERLKEEALARRTKR